MSSEIRQKLGDSVSLAITLASITDGNGRISTQVDNSGTWAPRVLMSVLLKTGAVAPTAGSLYKFYLIRDDGVGIVDEGLGAADAAVATEPENAHLVGTVTVTATADKSYRSSFLIEDPGYKWSVVFWNATGQTNSTDSNAMAIHYRTITPERR